MPPLDPLVRAALEAQAALVPVTADRTAPAPVRATPLSVVAALAVVPPAPLATAAAALALDAEAPGDKVLAGPRGPLRARDLLRIGVLELVLAGLDAGVVPDRQAVRVSCRLLAEVLAERHPGRSVEVRVPPYAAVQIGGPDGGGPVHTRGTPPAVVECAPEAFVAVASGRRRWADAVAAGDVRASGLRADLSAYLPVL